MADYSKGRSEEELEPFFPNEILRHTLLTFFFISAVMLGVLFFPESFQKSTDEFASFQTKPPWFLLPFFHFSSLINHEIWCVTVFAIYAIVFIFVPFLDRNHKRSLWKKPVFLSIVIINILMILALGITKYLQ
jgi:quinol-cytochrome oxidoreductase complex cytochrome b subunit